MIIHIVVTMIIIIIIIINMIIYPDDQSRNGAGSVSAVREGSAQVVLITPTTTLLSAGRPCGKQTPADPPTPPNRIVKDSTLLPVTFRKCRL